MFKPVTSRVNLPQVEENILKFWRENKTFEKSIANRKGGPRFTMYEGPPTANGKPGIHHVLSRIFKDIIPRHRAMKGYYAPRIAGWDTHGLPVELEVEKELGFTGKTQIEEYGIAKFNAKCRESVFRYLKDWDALTERIGYWCDLEHPYITMNNTYIESVWWAINRMWDKKLIYQGYRVTPHCPRCGTSLSSHEVALGYRDETPDPSVFIKFKVIKISLANTDAGAELLKNAGDKNVYLLAWTTTPWTLPGNTALAVAPDADYSMVEYQGELLIFASARLAAAGLCDAPVMGGIKGAALVNVEYEPLFNPHEYGIERRRFEEVNGHLEIRVQPPDKNLTYKVIGTDFVSMEDGTGIVHVAPAYGEVDYQAGERYKLNFVHMVDLQGKLMGSYPFAGKFVKTADPLVLENLKSRNLLYKAETIKHTYPFCWRCGTPLLYYAKQSWYIRTTAAKQRLITGNEEINWYPDHIKYGRFGDWLENNVDWAFSRERYWGTPLPVWRCEKCSTAKCIGGIEDLKKQPGMTGLKEPLDLHRPFVDEITFQCPDCKGAMKRVPEVIDCWFDSGAMPFAQYHYPFENKEMTQDGRFPADYICEAVDQTRGWFYSLHAESTLLFDKPSFHNVICLGHILDAKGEKMSKTRGNVVDPWKIIAKYGVDPLRWYFFTSSPPGNVRRFDEEQVADASRRFLMTLWNVYSFFINYANIDNFIPGAKEVPVASELDRWILSELNQLIADVDKGLEGYEPNEAGRRIEAFVDELSNWYVRRSRRRFWKSESDTDKISAYNTLYNCLVTLTKLMAPFTPFVAEEIYQNLAAPFGGKESVHLADFPKADMSQIDKDLGETVSLAMRVASLGRAARSQAGVKVRQPLVKLLIKLNTARRDSLRKLADQVQEEVNVKELVFVDELPADKTWPSTTEGDVAVMLDTDIPPELATEGMAREIVRRVQTMRRAAGFDITDHIIIYYQGDEYIGDVMKEWAKYIQQETLSKLENKPPADGAYAESYKLIGYDVTLGVKKEY